MGGAMTTTRDADESLTIDSRPSFHDAVLWALRAADAREARSLWLADFDFAEWPLDDGSVIDVLGAWLRRPQRRLVLLAESFDAMSRLHPRFCAWRPDWSHVVDARTPSDKTGVDLPSVLVDDGPLSLQVQDKVRWRGSAARDARAARVRRDQIDAYLQQSEAAWPVTTLGL